MELLLVHLVHQTAAAHDLVVALIENHAAEFVEAQAAVDLGRRRPGGKGAELVVEGIVTGAAERGAGALHVDFGDPGGHALHDRRHVRHALRQEYMQVACGAAFARQPPGLGRERADLGAVHGGAEHAEGGAQAAQRHARLVDADRPAALQDDGAVLRKIGPAGGRDQSQGDIGRGIGGGFRSGGCHRGRP